MRIKVYHRTRYDYFQAVSDNTNELRLTPKITKFQTVDSSFITILPATKLKHYDDLNFNRVHYFTIPKAHKSLLIESRSIVQTKKPNNIDVSKNEIEYSELELYRQLEECHCFLQNSTYVALTPEIWREAIDIRGSSNNVFQICHNIMECIYGSFKYCSNATSVSTHANEVIKGRAGVCQDFAHAMTAYCRSLGIPTRYISGYILDNQCDDNLRGNEASHAWVEIYLGKYGWIGFDPTNRKIVDDTYIILAFGRDYSDVAPVIGTYYGSGANTLTINVQVDRIE
ncbi:MAG: transglutaminase family protein [Verrucomicrobiota bacterium]|nr:transglutaminase family protein [Verrucomicrobiota bacterium]